MTQWCIGEVSQMEINGFYWFVKAEDFDDLGNVDIKISAGRLRHRWVPITKTAAKLFLRESAEAEGVLFNFKSLSANLIVSSIILNIYTFLINILPIV